jgi:hypothetical protein
MGEVEGAGSLFLWLLLRSRSRGGVVAAGVTRELIARLGGELRGGDMGAGSGEAFFAD